MSQQDRQSESEPDYTTVESHVEYDPSAVGTANLSAGEPLDDRTFPEYGLETVPILLDGEDTGRRFIRRNGDFVADVSDRYHLVPNEHAVHAANQVAEELGAVPFDEFGGDWYIPLDDHVFLDRGGTRVHALYAWDDSRVGEDDLSYGFAVHNSIDGSLSFQTGLFTFRHACQNMVLMGMDGRGMGFDDREVIAYDSHTHTSGLDVDIEGLADYIEEAMLVVEDIDDSYRAWRDEFVTVDDVLGLLDRLPSKDLPDWIDARDKPQADRPGDSIAAVLDDARGNEDLDGEDALSEANTTRIVRDGLHGTETYWSLYNDVTESIWHDGGTSDRTKDRKFTKLHRVRAPAEGVR